MDVFDAERPRTSEEENAELKRLLAEAMLDSAPSGAIASKDLVLRMSPAPVRYGEPLSGT